MTTDELKPIVRDGQQYLTVGQVRRSLEVSADTIRRWDKAGRLISYRLDLKNRYFLAEDIARFKAAKPLSTRQVGDLLGLSDSTVRRLEHQGVLTPLRGTHGQRMYDPAMLREYCSRSHQTLAVAPTNQSLLSAEINDSDSSKNECAYISLAGALLAFCIIVLTAVLQAAT